VSTLSILTIAIKLFHVRGPVTGSDRSPTVANLDRSTCRMSVSAYDLTSQMVCSLTPARRSNPFYTKIATIRCTGDARYPSCLLSVGLLVSPLTDILASNVQGSAIGLAIYNVNASDLRPVQAISKLCKFTDDIYIYLLYPASIQTLTR